MLRVLLQFFRAQESGEPFAFRFRPEDDILPVTGGDSSSARFEWTPAVLAELQALQSPGRAPAAVAVRQPIFFTAQQTCASARHTTTGRRTRGNEA